VTRDGASHGAAPVGAYEVAARVEDLPEGRLLNVMTARGEEICVYNAGGIIGAVSNTCTHQAFPMCDGTLERDGTIQCSWHGAKYNLMNGAVVEGPAVDPLPVFAVHIANGEVLVGPRKN
jgi:3-phenylpropionate/trans-cinnamate dioxygenase ferredoxin subunit/anthranilate 1,2-dioxygenase ferredoxin subunit